jgi:hypothetical protein
MSQNHGRDAPAINSTKKLSWFEVPIYLIKMAGVFMITTSTVAIYTGFAPRWLAVLGYVLSLLLLFGSYYIRWSFVVFPLWVFLISVCILVENLRRPPSR